ncbi:serine hydrolase [Pseudoxanthomonas sp. CF125]|uniref:serine hydrolase n=1 Tax=Pseudoxanthomonas sp. CF125 TaxID=1855303 RepID=UPI00087E223C|nr:serine hydrolase [Pseudoxanthomonas sp. CF125]SDR21654.1 CubicO group peptidase, beta-lactamase class C family [Pseudoxanthomonas sp. CF125]
MNLRFATLALALAAANAHAMTDTELRKVVDQRLHGDRTGACMAVAVIEKDAVARTFACADDKDVARIDANSAFEIGSVSKTMNAALLADLIGQGKASLDDPLADYLPTGTKVPAFEGRKILLRHVVTHTSGLPALPARLGATDMNDPYVNLTEDALLASLGDATLSAAPGTKFEYSNFASMVLSYAVAHRAGEDYETLIRQRLFAPLKMDNAYIKQLPAGVRAAQGHSPNGKAVSAWNFSTNLAGVGGVRATLDDMIDYVQGELGKPAVSITPALKLSQQEVSKTPPMAMNWMLMPVAGRTVHVHEGGTGGFSSFVAFDVARQRGVVILSDTTWNSLGSLGTLGLHLVDESFPLGKPRKAVKPPADLLEGLVGDYRVGAMKMKLSRKDGALVIQAEGQPAYTMAYDDAGDFYPLDFDALLRPGRTSSGYGFTWMQMGGVMAAQRVDGVAKAPKIALPAEELREYAGEYPLTSGFGLTVMEKDGRLFVQGTGQQAIEVSAVKADVFVADIVAAEIQFERDASGKVIALTLLQGGQKLRGERK